MAPDTLHALLSRDPAAARISTVVIRNDGDGWRAVIGYAGMGRMEPDEIEADVDMSQVPDSVAVRGWAADPDVSYPLPDSTPAQIEAAIAYLDNTGMLGTLSTLRVDGRWHIQTHGGSTEERLDWLRAVAEAGRV